MGGGDTRNRAVWRPASAVPVVAALLLAVSPAPVQGAKASWISGIDYKERTIPHGSTAGGTTMSITCSNDCVPFAGLQATNTSGWHGSILPQITFPGGTTLNVQRGKNQGDITVGVHVVKFNSSNVRVQTGTFFLDTNVSSTTASIPTSVNTAKAALVFNYRYSENNDNWGEAAVAGWISAGNQLTFQRSSSGSGYIDGTWYVFEALGSQFTVQQVSGGIDSGSTYADIALPASVAMSKTFILGSFRTPETGSNKSDSNALSAYMIGPQTVRVQRYATGGHRIDDVRLFAVTFGTDGWMQRSVWSPAAGTATGTITIPSVDTASAIIMPSMTAVAPGSMRAGGSSSQYAGHHYMKVKLTNATTVSASRGDSTYAAEGYFEAVEFKAGPTAVEMAAMRARRYGRRTLLEWRTGLEVDNLGFHVYREVGGARLRATANPVAGTALLAGPATVLRAGHSYAWWDESAVDGCRYWLEEWDISGGRTWHGPIEVETVAGTEPAATASATLAELGVGGAETLVERPLPGGVVVAGAAPPDAGPASAAAGAASDGASDAAVRPELPSRRRQWALASASPVTLGVRRNGWVRVGRDALVGAGLDPAADPRRLQLYSEAREVAIRIVGEADGRFDPGDALEFYGRGLDRPATDTRVYYLVEGAVAGRRIATVEAPPLANSVPASFPLEVVRIDRALYAPAIRNGETDNFFGPVVGFEPVYAPLPVHHLDPAGETTLTVRLRGLTSGPHRVGVRFNGVDLGVAVWFEQAVGEATFSLPAGAVVDGTAIVSLEPRGFEGDVSLLERLTLRYDHAWDADGGAIEGTAAGGATVAIAGFPSADPVVLDVSDPEAPVELRGSVDPAGGRWTARLTVHGEGERHLSAVPSSRVGAVAWVRHNRSSSLWAGPGADLVVVGPAELLDAVKPLVALREAQGLSVVTADVADVFDEFGAGTRGPEAIRAFLHHAASSWQRRARYALLVGDASLDPRDHLGFGARDLVPTKLLETGFLETASDDWLADFDDDGAADLALGRLPVANAEEAARVATKIVAHEDNPPDLPVLLVVDADEGDTTFASAAGQLRAALPAGRAVVELRRGLDSDETAKTRLLDELRLGPALVDYVGHGSVQLWAGGLLTAEDTAALSALRPTVVVSMTCLNGYFQDPTLDSLGEALLKSPSGGAVAVWASSALTPPQVQVAMNEAALRAIFMAPGRPRLGDVVLAAKRATGDRELRQTWVLFGDPTMRVP